MKTCYVNMLNRGVSYYTLTKGLQTAQMLTPDFFFIFFYGFTRKGVGKYVVLYTVFLLTRFIYALSVSILQGSLHKLK